jgi:hypothetical protein
LNLKQHISTITLQATEPDGGTITFNITNGALPTGLSLTGANIDGTTTAESSTTLYSFTIEAIDDENQATPRNFSITVNSAEIVPSQNFTINTYTGNGSTQSIEGKIGTAASFNGSSSYIQADGIFSSSPSVMSASLWFRTTADGNILDIGDNSISSAQNRIFFNSGLLYVSLNGGDGGFASTSATGLQDGNWHHIVAVWDDGSVTDGIKMYIDGATTPTAQADSTQSFNSALNLFIGANDNRAGGGAIRQHLNGGIDQVRIFNKALLSSEVTTLYNEPSNLSTASKTDIFDDGSGVALYEFEEGAIDTGGVNGYIGSGGIFNGSSTYITIPATATSPFDASAENFTISAWINVSAFQNDACIISKWGSTASTQSYFFGFNGSADNTKLIVYEKYGSSNYIVTSTSTAITTGSWFHVAYVRNSTQTIIYINGTAETFSNTNTINSGNSQPIIIGRQDGYSGTSFNGSIDQVRIFNEALSSSEVTTLYGETSVSSTKSTTDIFDDGSGVALYEFEGNANDSGKYGSGAIDEGQSIVFDGSSSKATTNYNALINNFSLSFYVKINDNSAYAVILGTTDSFASNEGLGMFYDYSANTIGFDGNINGTRITPQTGSYQVIENEWVHVAFTNNSSNNEKKLYINGKLQVNNTSLGYIDGQTYNLVLGSYNAYTNNRFNGQIDQFRIYSSVLSESDINALISETNVPTANLDAHYKFDGGVTDATGNYSITAYGTITYSDPAEFPTYDGTATNVTYGYDGTPTNVSFVGTSFQPDFVWIKNRDNGAISHRLHDSVRGRLEYLSSDLTLQELTSGQNLNSFDTNGFTVSGTGNSYNAGDVDYVAWCWKAGGTVSANNNSNGDITSTVSANQDAGFSIVSYTGNSSYGQTVGHGLSSAPELVIIKNRDNARNWRTYAEPLGATKYLNLDENAGAGTYGSFNNTAPTTTVFSTTSSVADRATNYSGDKYIAYCFHSVDGYQKVGSYTSNASVKITTGFEPRWIMIKYTGAANDWWIMDTLRYDGSTGSHGGKLVKPYLEANESFLEQSVANGSVEFVSDGFYPTNFFNSNGVIYLAIA